MLLRSPCSARRIASASVSRALSMSFGGSFEAKGSGGTESGGSIQFWREAGSIMRRSPCGHGTGSRTIARTGRAVRRKICSANWGRRDGHLGPADGDDEPKRAHGVGEGSPPWLSTLPVDGGVLLDRIGIGDLEMGRNDLADREGQRNPIAEA